MFILFNYPILQRPYFAVTLRRGSTSKGLEEDFF